MLMLLALLLQVGELKKDAALHQVQFQAEIFPSQFNHGDGLADHHLIVWKGGRAASHALFRAEVSDQAILAALVALGGKPGDNLSASAWTQRFNPLSDAPDVQVKGTPVLVSFSWANQSYEVADVLEDTGGRRYDFRLGGHEALIPQWRSGCVVCLESCPGGRISNASYTMRDLALGRANFRVRKALPADGTKVLVTLRLALD